MQNQSPIFLITTTFLAHELPSAQVFLLFRGFIATPAKHICPCEVNLWPSASVRRRHIGLTVERLYTDRGGTYLSPPPFFFLFDISASQRWGQKSERWQAHRYSVTQPLFRRLIALKVGFSPNFSFFFFNIIQSICSNKTSLACFSCASVRNMALHTFLSVCIEKQENGVWYLTCYYGCYWA